MEHRSIYAFGGLRYVVPPVEISRCRQSVYAFFIFDFPSAIRIRNRFAGGIAFEYKSSTICDLGQRHNAEIPHCRRDLVSSGMQDFGKIVGLISPMSKIASRRASPDLLLIDPKDELSVRADMNNEMLWSLWNLE